MRGSQVLRPLTPGPAAVAAAGGMSYGFFYRRVGRPLLDLLRQGVAPEKIALSVALGVVLGVFPVLGATTALCALAAFALQLNLPAIQVVNYFVYPLQIALLLPLFRLGERFFRSPHLVVSLPQMQAMMRANMGDAIGSLWTATWHAVVVWCVLAPPCVGGLYAVLAPVLRRATRGKVPRAGEAA